MDYGKIGGAVDTLSMVAPDIVDYPLLWAPILGEMATYREVMVDDVYGLVDLDRMIAALDYKKGSQAYDQFVMKAEQEASKNRK